MKSLPSRSTWRAALRTASGPSATMDMMFDSSAHPQLATGISPDRVSPWPPVWVSM